MRYWGRLHCHDFRCSGTSPSSVGPNVPHKPYWPAMCRRIFRSASGLCLMQTLSHRLLTEVAPSTPATLGAAKCVDRQGLRVSFAALSGYHKQKHQWDYGANRGYSPSAVQDLLSIGTTTTFYDCPAHRPSCEPLFSKRWAVCDVDPEPPCLPTL